MVHGLSIMLLFQIKHVVEYAQWTDEDGNVISTDWNALITPPAPGIQYVGVTSVIDDCRSITDEGTQKIAVYVDYAYAGKDIISDKAANGECGKSIVTLNAYDNYLSAEQNLFNGAWDGPTDIKIDYPGSWVGTTKTGTWSILSGNEINNCAGDPAKYYFDGDETKLTSTNPRATFTGEPGIYTLTYTLPALQGQSVGCSSDVQVEITTCENINFDGLNDHIFFTKDNYNLAGQGFSLEAWVKPNEISGTKTIISKRAASIPSGSGYDLSIKDGKISFSWGNGGNIVSASSIGIDRWYHIAVTFDGSTYKLYIDGIDDATKAGLSLLTTDFDCLVGAMDNTATIYENPVNFYNGYMQELRVWNKALTPEQLHQMMNQKIVESGTGGVIGEIVPVEVNGLSW